MPDLGFSVLDIPDGQVEQEVQDKFRQAFAFDENEKVLGCKLGPDALPLIGGLPNLCRFPRPPVEAVPDLWTVVRFRELFLFQVERCLSLADKGARPRVFKLGRKLTYHPR